MVSKIKFKFKGKKYILEYTRHSICEMERRGFDVTAIPEKTFTLLPDMFAGAFLANHPEVRRGVVDEIYTQFENKAELLDALAGMYSLAIEDYLNELTKVRHGVKWEKC